MIQTDIEKIKEITREFFSKTGLLVEAVEVKGPQGSTLPINLKIEEPQILIGEGGQTLVEIQRILKILINKKISADSSLYIDLDINDYKKKKVAYLKEVARSAADEAIFTRQEQTLPPMSAYDRRIIHLELAPRTDVATESLGSGLDRRIVIKVK